MLCKGKITKGTNIHKNSFLNITTCLLNTSASLHMVFVADAHSVEG
jgi:hypothetical protein